MRFVALVLFMFCLAPKQAIAESFASADTMWTLPNTVPKERTPDERLMRELQYQAEKKEVGLAVLLGLLLPGAGNYYVGDILGGTFLLGAAITGAALYSSEDVDTSNLGGVMLVAAAITSPISAGVEANSRNKKLRKRLGIALWASPSHPGLAVLVQF